MVARVAAPRGQARANVGPKSGHAHTLPCQGGLEAAGRSSGATHSESYAAGAPRAPCQPCRRRDTRVVRCRCRVRCSAGPSALPPDDAWLTPTLQPFWLVEAMWDRGGSISLRPFVRYKSACSHRTILFHASAPALRREDSSGHIRCGDEVRNGRVCFSPVKFHLCALPPRSRPLWPLGMKE
jgi:hypothetical protein